jgi:hypothetical protein
MAAIAVATDFSTRSDRLRDAECDVLVIPSGATEE